MNGRLTTITDFTPKPYKGGKVLINDDKIRFVPTNCYSPNHPHCKSWVFPFTNEHEEYEAIREAELCQSMAEVGAMNGMDANDLNKLFPAVLRMLKSNSNYIQNC